MIKVFSSTDTDFSSNGDKVLQPIKAVVHNEDNGDFYLNLEVGLEYIDYLTEGRILVANTPQGNQAFRINNVQKTKSKLSAKCWHVFYDSKNYLIDDSYVVNKDCYNALEYLNSATEPESIFRVGSDITTVDSLRCVRKSLFEAVQTVVERWGGHLYRDNHNIYVLSEIGTDNGVVVRYRKNLQNITCTENWDKVVTKLMPVGRDGLLLPEVYIESDLQYSIPYTKTVSFSQDLDKDDYESDVAYQSALVSDLREKSEAYLAENSLPKVNYKLTAGIQQITGIGDVVQVIDERLGVNLLTEVIAYDYDCILKRYKQIEFGNFRSTFASMLSGSVTNQINLATVALSAEIAAKQDHLVAGENVTITGNTISANIVAENYETLYNKPQINGNILTGNKTGADLGLISEADLSNALASRGIVPHKIYFDTTANWNAQVTLVSESNAVYIYTDYQTIDGHSVAGIKVGDGMAYVIDLPFLDTIYARHIQDEVRHITQSEREFWNNKNRAYMSLTDTETLILTAN